MVILKKYNINNSGTFKFFFSLMIFFNSTNLIGMNNGCLSKKDKKEIIEYYLFAQNPDMYDKKIIEEKTNQIKKNRPKSVFHPSNKTKKT